MSKYQDELQRRHGNVFFASADWANGWRGAIDGALEQGTMAAHTAIVELRKLFREDRRQVPGTAASCNGDELVTVK